MKLFVHYAGPIPYTLENSGEFIHAFDYKRMRNKKTFVERVYLKSLQHGEQLIAIYNRYAKLSGSNWEYIQE